jgi:hypothetical protein
MSRLKSFEEEIAALQAKLEWHQRYERDLVLRYNALREAALEYSFNDHDDQCKITRRINPVCNCGYVELKAALEPKAKILRPHGKGKITPTMARAAVAAVRKGDKHDS